MCTQTSGGQVPHDRYLNKQIYTQQILQASHNMPAFTPSQYFYWHHRGFLKLPFLHIEMLEPPCYFTCSSMLSTSWRNRTESNIYDFTVKATFLPCVFPRSLGSCQHLPNFVSYSNLERERMRDFCIFNVKYTDQL